MSNVKTWLPKVIIDALSGIFGSKESNSHRPIRRIPLEWFGLNDMPAVPLDLRRIPSTLNALSAREVALTQAKNALSNDYTIQEHTANAYSFMFSTNAAEKSEGEKAREKLKDKISGPFGLIKFLISSALKKRLENEEADEVEETLHALNTLSLDAPSQYSMGWTNYFDMSERFQNEFLDDYTKTLKDADAATDAFFPMIANQGMAYNLLLTKKLKGDAATEYKNLMGSDWTDEMETAAQAGLFYAIDMRIFENFAPKTSNGITRFTPGTVTFLLQDTNTKELKPIAVRATGEKGANLQVYHRSKSSNSAWLYALQAAKTSITVYGIWLGHVYHWHIVTAAMQMTFYNHVPRTHKLFPFLAPQCNYLIPFDDALLILWRKTAPPTAIASGKQFLQLCNYFAKDRNFFDDDPHETLTQLGISESDFTKDKPWDKYPFVQNFIEIWDASKNYVGAWVDASYSSDAEVAGDAKLQKWMNANSKEKGGKGNISGIPEMNSKENLKRVLTSFIYRITVHGCSRLNRTANPALTFVGNFPPTLHKTDFPKPDADFDTKTLLSYMPKTGTIGKMMMFYLTFLFSPPYEPLIPVKGVDDNLFFSGGKDDARNKALIKYREDIQKFIERFDTGSTTVHQWPLNIET